MEVLTRETSAPQSNHVETNESRWKPKHVSKRRDIIRDASQTANHGVTPDAHHLMDRSAATEETLFADLHMTAEHHIVGKNNSVANLAVVADMAVRHEKAVGADRRYAVAADASAMNRDVLSQLAARSDNARRRFAAILQILRGQTYRGIGGKARFRSDPCAPGHHDVRAKLYSRLKNGLGANNAEWTDPAPRPDSGTWSNEGRRVDCRRQGNAIHRIHRSRIMAA